MKKLFLWLGGLLLIALFVYLNESGLVTWQPLTIILAAIAAPFKFVLGLFTENTDHIQKRHEVLRQKETHYQEELSKDIVQRKQKIANLDEQLVRLESELQLLDMKRTEIDKQVNSLDAEGIQNAVWKYAGK